MADGERTVLVCLDTADESEVPMETAAAVAASAGDDLQLRICSFYPPADEPFGQPVESLGAAHRLDPAAYRRLIGLLGDADLLHVHSNAVGAVARVLAAVRRTPAIKTAHNTHDDWGRAKRVVNGLANVLSDAVIAVSEAVADSFAGWEDRLLAATGGEKVVIHDGVDVAAVDAAAARDPPVALPAGFRVGCGGRHVPQKNLAAAVEAAAAAARHVPDLHLVVTGDGPRRAALERLAADRGIADRVTFTGFLPERAAVHALYHRLDVFAFPSRHEGFGVAAAEAMTAGVPVVAADIPVLREVVGDAGLFAAPDDHGALADALVALAGDPDRRRALGRRGRERVDRRFRLDRAARDHRDLYAEYAAGGG